MKKEDFVGVWKLEQYAKGKVITSHTHLVVKDDVLWEVHPRSVYYENRPGPDVKYVFEEGQEDQPAKVSTADGYKYLVAKNGDTLHMKLGPVYGYFPESFDDSGNLAEYKLESEEIAKTVRVLPVKVKVEEFELEGYGVFKFDSNIDWWEGSTEFKGKRIDLNISVDEGDKYTPFERVKEKLAELEKIDFAEIAANNLLALYNEEWRDEDDEKLTQEEFMEQIELESITLNSGGESTICFNDADLFLGHQIRIELDGENNVEEVAL